MATTSPILLARLKAAGPAASDWRRLHDLYAPVVRGWLARVPGLAGEADDLAQEVMAVLVRELPGFDRRRDGAFRAWLRRVTANRARSWARARRRRPAAADYLDRLADPAGDPAREWDREYDRQVFARLLAAVRGDFRPATWQAFRLTAVAGLSAAEAAAVTGLTENAVLLAKSRVLRRLREEAAELLD